MKNFNVRVYGICINYLNEVLLCDENFSGLSFTKFPGGGLEWGEGLLDCLKREWQEELNIEINIVKHFYTTDFFQKSAFDNSQLISIYYLVTPSSTSVEEFRDLTHHKSIDNSFFHWKKIAELEPNDVTFPIDKMIVEMLKR